MVKIFLNSSCADITNWHSVFSQIMGYDIVQMHVMQNVIRDVFWVCLLIN